MDGKLPRISGVDEASEHDSLSIILPEVGKMINIIIGYCRRFYGM